MTRRPFRQALLGLAAALPLAGVWPGLALAAPSVWDQDQDRIDDRAETVHLLGYPFSFELSDTTLRQRFVVTRSPGGLVYGVYVMYTSPPSASDLASLALLGMTVSDRFENWPAVRTQATFAQIQAAALLPNVERIETVPILYPVLHDARASGGVDDASQRVFPTWRGVGGGTGHGVVVGILDTGVNDAPSGPYPGHESLLGRCLGGASFVLGDSALDTPRDGSVNPEDHGGPLTGAHGTHVAGIILGSGGPSAYASGVAPDARFVDVKVLSDDGSGSEIAEGLDWCIHNRARLWSAGDPDYQGIDVINLSLSSLDYTDGTDLASRLAQRATELGISVVASVGNGGKTAFVPSPAGADDAIAVGAIDDQRTGAPEDDALPSFSDQGPRPSDQDGDVEDERKPDLVAPGVAILSADGDLSSDGTHYKRLTGTSMSAAFVSGTVAAIRGDYPSLTPVEIRSLLRRTARPLAFPDPPPANRWTADAGYGAIDLYAARLEIEQPERSQVRRLELTSADSTVHASLWTMRERDVSYFTFERAPDVSGAPGPFTAIDSVQASGDSSLADGTNTQRYERDWPVPSQERGRVYWYRMSHSEGGLRYFSPARSLTLPAGSPVATIHLEIAHNAYDSDLTGEIRVPGGAASPALTIPLPGTSAATSSDWVDGASTLGNVEWTFDIPVPDGAAASYLPPGPSQPWALFLDEGGFLNRSGRLLDFRLIWHGPSGDEEYVGGPTPEPTVEGQTTVAWIPQTVVDAGGPAASTRFTFFPNPAPGGGQVTFAVPAGAVREVQIFDLAGRRVGTAAVRTSGQTAVARWTARDRDGRTVAPGVYFVRAGERTLGRMVIVASR
jgi:subtilisin family serine protease